jgi:putative transposase
MLNASGAAESDRDRAIVGQNHRHRTAALAQAEHPIELGRVFLDVDVLERDVPPTEVVTGGLCIGSRVLAEDDRHLSIVPVTHLSPTCHRGLKIPPPSAEAMYAISSIRARKCLYRRHRKCARILLLARLHMRRSRIYMPDVSVHVIHRGNNRMAIFGDEEDRYVFLSFLQSASARFNVRVHAYVLMTTHYHLLLTPQSDVAMPRAMKSLAGRYSEHFNRKNGRCGTLWSERYQSVFIADERQLLTCLRYIEQNPVRAHMVDSPGAYRWSSYAFHAEGQASDWLVRHPVYLSLGSSDTQRRAAYRALCGTAVAGEDLEVHRHATGGQLVTGG